MSTFKKFYERLKRLPNDITFEELHSFLTSDKIGWQFRVNGSHYTYYIFEDGIQRDVTTIP